MVSFSSPVLHCQILITHSGTGIGALVAPLVATQFSEMQKWSYFFFISLGLALINIITIYMSFGSERIESQYLSFNHGAAFQIVYNLTFSRSPTHTHWPAAARKRRDARKPVSPDSWPSHSACSRLLHPRVRGRGGHDRRMDRHFCPRQERWRGLCGILEHRVLCW